MLNQHCWSCTCWARNELPAAHSQYIQASWVGYIENIRTVVGMRCLHNFWHSLAVAPSVGHYSLLRESLLKKSLKYPEWTSPEGKTPEGSLLKESLLKVSHLKESLPKEILLKESLLKGSLPKESLLKEGLLREGLLKQNPVRESPLTKSRCAFRVDERSLQNCCITHHISASACTTFWYDVVMHYNYYVSCTTPQNELHLVRTKCFPIIIKNYNDITNCTHHDTM